MVCSKGLQVTTQEGPTKEIASTAVDKWLESIDWRDSMEKVRIAVVPRAIKPDTSKGKFTGGGSGYLQLEVWKVPLDYGRQF